MIHKFEPKSLEDAVRLCVAPIDEHLADSNVPLSDRMLQAAFLFVQHNIVSITGDSKDDFFEKPWFKTIYQTVRSWYENKYGAALKRQHPILTAACLISGALFRLNIPITLSRVEKEGETAWLVFPVDVQSEDDPKTWFVAPPHFDALDTAVRDKGLEAAVEAGRLLRSIHSDLMTANQPDDIATGLVGKTLTHIENAARILTDRKPMFGLAVWESHQTVESALKFLSRQLTGNHPKDHEVRRLFNHIKARTLGIDADGINKMPSAKRILEIRAGEGSEVEADEAYAFYRLALTLSAQITCDMPGLIRMRNAALLIKKAPFI
jgi:HEPN domain-containing protein